MRVEKFSYSSGKDRGERFKAGEKKISGHQVKILERVVSELVEWAHSKRFADKITLELINDRIDKMVEDGLIHAYQRTKLFGAFKIIFDVTVLNHYSPAEYKAKIAQEDSEDQDAVQVHAA
ncbi:MAG: hypothetical protein JNK10_09010 [Cyclobacteriaceae bacterium]|nr:hypothetical protein [Cyclobacteriaceae bacterium]